MERVGKRLKELREKHNYTLRYVGEQLDIDYSYLSKVEKGTTTSIPTLEKLAEFYNKDISYFFGDKKEIPDDLEDYAEWIALADKFKNEKISPEDVEKIVEFIKSDEYKRLLENMPKLNE